MADSSYHGIETNPYPLPNDKEEIYRLNELHYCLNGLFKTNVVAPISANPTDIGIVRLNDANLK
jgi:hypothetical protein